MPRLENIERFKEILYALGSEPQVNARRSEAREDDLASAGEAGAAEDLGLDSEGTPGADDFQSLGLDDLLGEGHEGSASLEESVETSPSDLAQEPEADAAAFDMDSGADGFDDVDIADLLGEPAVSPATGDEAGEGEAGEAEAGEGELIGGELGDEELPAGEASSEEAPSEGQPGEGEADLANGFFMPDLGLEDPGESAAPELSPPEELGAEVAPIEAAALEEPDAAEGPGEDAFDPFAVDFGAPEATEGAEVATDAGTLAEDAPADTAPPSEPAGATERSPGEETAFDAESFDISALGTEEVGEQASGAAEGIDASIDELADGFSLEGLSAEGLDESSAETDLTPSAEESVPEGEEAEGARSGEVSLEGREFRSIQRNLAVLPRNLKIAIETLIGEQGYAGDGLRPLLELLSSGASPHEIAAQVSKLSGRTIRIPERFERRTGAAFEQEQRSPGYLFRQRVLPLLRTVLLVGSALGILTYGGYSFVYVPLRARSLYRAGYLALEQERYADSELGFRKAIEVRPVKRWYYRYAEGYAQKREYTRADDVYRMLEERWGYDRKELLDRARLHSTKLASFGTAEALLGKITDKDFHDYDALLALGDNYLEWARHAPVQAGGEKVRTRASLLEEARRSFALLLERYGYKNAILFHMMRYFMRANLTDDVQDLRAYLEAQRDFKPDPEVYAELGGYLLDRDDLEGARTVLYKAAAQSTVIPEIDYHLARLLRVTDQPAEEAKALANAIVTLGEAEQTPERIFMAADAHRRYGELYYRQERYLDATREFGTAIAAIEEGQEAGTLQRLPELGLAYQGLGDVAYYVDADYEAALPLYARARWNGVEDPALDYRVGYIRYAQGDYAEAVRELVPAQEKLPRNWNVLFGLATALYQRGDYLAAEGYYRRLLDRLTDKRDAIANLRPEVNPDHFMLANLLIKAHNNLGVTYYMLARGRGLRGRELTRALVEVTQAAEYLDIMARAPGTLERSEAKNLAYLNASGMQHPTSAFEPAIYDRLPKDTEADRF